MADVPYYVHDLNPVLLHIGGPLAIRWYGLAYLAGFVVSYLLLLHLSRRGFFKLPAAEVSNFMLAIGLFGVMMGGRLGNALFYDFKATMADPLSLFRIWEGGMASHGGMIGCALVMIWYARRFKVPLINITDCFCYTAPLGLMFGRIANFINGELWGRITAVKWAVIFPLEAGYPAGTAMPPQLVKDLLDSGRLHPRHPSQLYEAFGEGILLFALLWFLQRTSWGRTGGRLTAAFLAGYATLRILVEFVREPETGDRLLFGWMTTGQMLSAFMYIAALVALIVGRRATPPAGAAS